MSAVIVVRFRDGNDRMIINLAADQVASLAFQVANRAQGPLRLVGGRNGVTTEHRFEDIVQLEIQPC